MRTPTNPIKLSNALEWMQSNRAINLHVMVVTDPDHPRFLDSSVGKLQTLLVRHASLPDDDKQVRKVMSYSEAAHFNMPYKACITAQEPSKTTQAVPVLTEQLEPAVEASGVWDSSSETSLAMYWQDRAYKAEKKLEQVNKFLCKLQAFVAVQQQEKQ